MKPTESGSTIGDADRQWFGPFKRMLDSLHDSYNADNRMLRRPFASPGYHTAIKQADYVHPTRETTDYALALLDGGDPSYRQRAFDIIGTIVALQDQDPDSATYGIWSWFREEPLAQMSPPDWNWADFIGKRLLLVLIRHGQSLPPELREALERAIGHCCESIIRRNVGPEYTNIAIMGTFVTLVAGETLQVERFKQYGINRLQRLHRYTMESRSFLEYNSPTYGIVAIVELSGLVRHVRDERSRELAKELLELTWTMAAEHFHPALKEWAGPHARSYDTFLRGSRLSFFHVACGGQVPLIAEQELVYELEWYGGGIRCPDKLLPLFEDNRTAELRRALPASPEFRRRTAYTYMTPTWTLGTFNHGIMWNQCRNLLAYAGRDSAGSYYARLRVLHDGYDYCSAVFFGEQRQGNALFGIRFALDGGGTHPNLDPVNGRIRAADFRIRLEIGCKGEPPACSVANDRTATVMFPGTGVVMHYEFAYGAMSGFGPFRLQLVRDDAIFGLDVVLHHGEPVEFDFRRLEAAAFLFALACTEGMESPSAYTVAEGGAVTATLETGVETLRLKMGTAPLTRHDLFHERME